MFSPQLLRRTGGLLFAAAFAFAHSLAAENLGQFAGHTDIGQIKHPGTVAYDGDKGTYTITGSGGNMWFNEDDFHFVWKKVSGNVALAATPAFVGHGTEAHRKAVLMIRQSLDPASPYVDVAAHADGLTSLQFRLEPGGNAAEIQTTAVKPHRVRIEKIGDTAYLSVAGENDALAPTGCSIRLPFTGEFYVGIGVCAHNADQVETIEFSGVEISTPATTASVAVRSIIETIPIPGGDRRALHHSDEIVEAPNWSRDGGSLVFNRGGRIHRLPLAKLPDGKLTAGASVPIDTGGQVKCNDDHGLSPDGSQLVISDSTKDGKSRIYILPATGGAPRELTPNAPSYWHGWSPDGRTLAFCGQRDGKFGIFTVPAAGGEEKRLTTTDGLDDGPDYSADGQWIYFNSDRTGHMQIWRMHADGTNLEQVTHDDYNNWFAHPSPNGRWLVFLSYAPDVKGHPRDHDVMLRLRSLDSGETRVLVKLFGGQGTINVPSWAPDSSRIAYVRYQPTTR